MPEEIKEEMKIEYIPIGEIIPYDKNPRKNDKAVDVLSKSIKEFGFKVPIVLDKDNIIVTGHTRLKAAMKLGMQEVPIIWADDLTPKQIKAFRIMDNKSQEHSYWDYGLLKQELFELKDLGVSLDLTGFSQDEIDFFNPKEDGQANNAYEEWRRSGVLEYGNEDKTGYKTILLHFKTEKDIRKFSELINQTITNKTKYLWFPKQEVDKVVDLEYREEQ